MQTVTFEKDVSFEIQIMRLYLESKYKVDGPGFHFTLYSIDVGLHFYYFAKIADEWLLKFGSVSVIDKKATHEEYGEMRYQYNYGLELFSPERVVLTGGSLSIYVNLKINKVLRLDRCLYAGDDFLITYKTTAHQTKIFVIYEGITQLICSIAPIYNPRAILTQKYLYVRAMCHKIIAQIDLKSFKHRYVHLPRAVDNMMVYGKEGILFQDCGKIYIPVQTNKRVSKAGITHITCDLIATKLKYQSYATERFIYKILPFREGKFEMRDNKLISFGLVNSLLEVSKIKLSIQFLGAGSSRDALRGAGELLRGVYLAFCLAVRARLKMRVPPEISVYIVDLYLFSGEISAFD